MPLNAANCTPCDEQFCNDLHRIAQHLLEKSYEALSSCFLNGCDGQVVAYVTSGQGDDGVMDQLTVSMLSINPSLLTTAVGPGLYRALFEVRLHESGWPTARNEGGVIIPPQPEEQANAIGQLMAHGEALHRRLAYLKATKTITPAGMFCLQCTIGEMTPVFPQGGVAGWVVLITLDLPWH